MVMVDRLLGKEPSTGVRGGSTVEMSALGDNSFSYLSCHLRNHARRVCSRATDSTSTSFDLPSI